MIEIRGRLISQRHCTRRYMTVVGGSLVMWDTFLHLVVLGDPLACPTTVRCRSTPDLVSRRTWVDRCLLAFPGPCCPAVLLISALDVLRSSFEENNVAECGLFYRVAIWNT